MVASSFLSALVFASCVIPSLARPANTNGKTGNTAGTRAAAVQPELEARWVALGDNFLTPGSFKKSGTVSNRKTVKRAVVEDSEVLRKRAAVAQALAILEAEEQDHLERRQQVCSVVTVTKVPRPSATESSAAPAPTGSSDKSCNLTSDCVGQPIPANANPYCLQSTKSCSFRECPQIQTSHPCNRLTLFDLTGCWSKFSLVDGACVQGGAATTA